MTSERQIYGGGPGAQKYLVLLETTLQCRTLDELATPPGAKNIFADSFRLEIALYPSPVG